MLKAVKSPVSGLVRELYNPQRFQKQTIQAKATVSLKVVEMISENSNLKIVPKKASITRRDYPKIVKLKLAGHSDESIAKRIGVPTELLKPHLSKALNDYRKGEFVIDAGGAVEEARDDAAEEAAVTVSGISAAVEPAPLLDVVG